MKGTLGHMSTRAIWKFNIVISATTKSLPPMAACSRNHSDMAMAKVSSLPWQCDRSGPQQRLEYLFNTGCFSDINIKCPGGFSYDLHRMVLAMCSPVFEAMLFGTLATSHNSLCLEDDPNVIRYVFEHCYGCDVQCDDILVVLNIFKIADKYIINDLKNKCTLLIQNLIKPDNFQTIYNFTVKYGYNDLRHSCISLLQQDTNNVRATAVLMWFSLNSPSDLLIPVFSVKKLSFDTWRNPNSEQIGDLATILQSNCCNDLQEFAGQVSGDVVEYIPGPFRSTGAKLTNFLYPYYVPMLKFSIQKSNVYEVLMALNERYKKYGPEDIAIHITNDDLPAVCDELFMHDFKCDMCNDELPSESKALFKLPCNVCISNDESASGIVTLYISDLTEDNLYDLQSFLDKVHPKCDENHKFVKSYMFPRCKLTREKFIDFSDVLAFAYGFIPSCGYMWICSPNIEIRDEEIRGSEDLVVIKVMSCDNDIPGW